MKTVTTKAIAKVAAVATGLAMATSMLALAPTAYAAALTSAQVQSILSLLSSFGADASTIANVQASLTGGTPTTTTTTGGTTTTTSGGSCSFTKDLTIGSTGSQVTALQNLLLSKGFSIPAGATGYFGGQTQAAVSAWQKSAGVTPTAGYFGAKSRAAIGCSSSTTTTTTTTTTGTVSAGTGNGLKIMISPTSPNGTVLVQGQGIGDLGDFVFANPTASPINVTALTFNRIGVSNDSTMTNVYLYNGGTRITDSAGVSASAFTFSDPVALFTVPAGQTYTVSVRSDILNTANGQQIGVKLVSATSNATLDSSVSLPIMSGYQTVSAASLATVVYGAVTTPSDTTISPQNDYPIWQNTISVSQNPVKLSSMRFTNLGSIDSAYVTNLRLIVDGVQVGAALPSLSANRTATFDASASPLLLSTQSHTVKVLANITGGASRTIRMSVQRSSDGMFVDNQLNQPVTPTVSGSANFSAVTAGSSTGITINSVSASSGVSVSLDPASPNQTIAVGASNQKFASFDMLASGENVKVSDLYVYADTNKTGTTQPSGLNNGKIMVNGVQVGSTHDLIEGDGASVAYGSATDFSLGSSLILPAGQTTKVDVYADAQYGDGSNLTNVSSVTIYLSAGSSNAQGQSSLNSANVPAANTSSNAITVTNSSLTVTKYSGYGNQTIVAGTNSAKIGAFTLSAGSTEGVTVNTIGLAFTNAVSSTITNLTLKDDATGSILGSVITTPGSTALAVNSFAVNIDVPASSTKTIDVYANVLSGAKAGPLPFKVDYTTGGTGDVTGTSAVLGSSSTANVSLQTMTIGSGALTVTNGAADPVSNNVLAGASSVMVGEFNFAAQNSAYTVNNFAILIPNGVASSVTNVTVSYKDMNGVVQTATQPLAVSSTKAMATASFTGLMMYVPTNDSANLDVYIGTPTIASGATSGANINVKLDAGALNGTDFRAVNSAGSPLAIVNSGTDLAGNGTFYVRKSIPTFAMVPVSSTVPSTGTPLYKFSVSADPAGAIEWSKVTFNIGTSSGSSATNITNVYLTDEATGNSLFTTGHYATTTSNKINVDLKNFGATAYQQIAAGSMKTYDLYGTVSSWTTGATISLSLAADTGTVANGTSAVRAGGTTLNNVVWSDRSFTGTGGHTTTSSDWTNGYLLKNFTSSAISYSK